ncbi:hypothetical protein TGVEG_287440 [Toxoplasma gondii VEG]|uniref:Uncharacterized protein n=1 Tax=Toxoplasma gondii (strain ATCC 50861 / VEG) TaxID=432359 RepID=V4Z2I9_TOXGV|nr:hypothetical protein TGVEG_287440 [Toxoplasma gondii VEG]
MARETRVAARIIIVASAMEWGGERRLVPRVEPAYAARPLKAGFGWAFRDLLVAGPGAQGGPGIQGVSAETESAEFPEATSPVPGCSWWSTSPPVTSLSPTAKGVEPGSSAEDKVTGLQRDLKQVHSRRIRLVRKHCWMSMRWRDEATFVNLRLQMMNTRRKKKKVSYAEQRRLLTGPGRRPGGEVLPVCFSSSRISWSW